MNSTNVKTVVGQGKKALVATLFGIVLVLQFLDLHSTLRSQTTRIETNPGIAWLAAHVGLAPAVAAVKLAVMLALAYSFQVWRRTKGEYDVMFGAGLLVTGAVYTLVVGNNYLQ